MHGITPLTSLKAYPAQEYMSEKLENSLSDEEKQTWSTDYSLHSQIVKTAIDVSKFNRISFKTANLSSAVYTNGRCTRSGGYGVDV